MRNRSNQIPSMHQQIALDYLELVRADMDRVARQRINYIRLAREYGLTNAEIGSALGVTEGAVRGLLARNIDIADKVMS